MGWEVGLTVPGAVLKAQRKALGHSQADAARIIDTHRSVFSRWENSDVAAISTRHAAAVRSYLRLSPAGSSDVGCEVSSGYGDTVCAADRCEHYARCETLMHAGLWTLCEVEPPTLADLLRYEGLLQAGKLDPVSIARSPSFRENHGARAHHSESKELYAIG